MEFHWKIVSADTVALRECVASNSQSTWVVDRLVRNVDGACPAYTRAAFWEALMMCLLTSQQRSGLSSPVSRFLDLDPFPLSLVRCEQGIDEKEVASILSSAGGIRYHNRIAGFVVKNLILLDTGSWSVVEEWVGRLRSQRERAAMGGDQSVEREASNALDDIFWGLGPKQARNLWQYMGLTRYEIPLDSRVAKWLTRNGFPIPISSTLLGDRGCYCMVLDAVQQVCSTADIPPCVFDAAAFATFDD